jgi:hypothetical protein
MFLYASHTRCLRLSRKLVSVVRLGFAAKKFELAVSLGTYVRAAMIADLLWCIFMIAGPEQVHFGSGTGAANYFVAMNIA